LEASCTQSGVSHQQANLFWKPMYLVQLVESKRKKDENPAVVPETTFLELI
jgi:hypothetical protein